MAAVFLIALGSRLLYLQQLSETPYARALIVDEEAYDERGRAIAAGDASGLSTLVSSNGVVSSGDQCLLGNILWRWSEMGGRCAFRSTDY